MKLYILLLTMLALSGCNDNSRDSWVIPHLEREVPVLVKIQNTVLLPDGREVAGYTDTSGHIAVIRINKDNLECLDHELRHVFYGAWHKGSSNDCH